MAKTETQEIRGTTYRLFKLAPLEGGRLATRVGQLLAAGVADGDTLASLIKTYRDKTAEAPVDGVEQPKAPNPLDVLQDDTKLLQALAGGLARIDADALYTMGLQCFTGGIFAGERKLHDTAAQNAWFEDHPDHLLLCLAWALKVNCAGFFGKGGPA